MIVNYLNCVSIAIFPNKAYAILIVNPDTVLSQPVPLLRFQPIARENRDIGEFRGCIDLDKLSFNDGSQSIESFGIKPLKDQLSIFGSKGSNHQCIVIRSTSYVKKSLWLQVIDLKAESSGARDDQSRVICS